jgi:hypothetical protein
MTAGQVEQIILAAIETVNLTREPDAQVPVSPTAPLYGSGAPLDSLGLVTLLIGTEEGLREAGANVTLADDRAMSQTRSPFRSVPALVEYVLKLTGEGV